MHELDINHILESIFRGRWNPNGLHLHYRFSSIIDFYAQAMKCTPTGKKDRHEKHITAVAGRMDSSFGWKWAGIMPESDKTSLQILLSRKFAYREGIEEIERESQKMVQGHRKRIYTWNELDGDDLSMERLRDHLPAMQRRVYKQGDKLGGYISLYFNIGVNGGVRAEEMMYKTKTAVKLIKFFESIGKRVEVIVFSKAANPGNYNDKEVATCLLEITIKKFTDPLNISLINTALSPWMLRYWEFLFCEGHMSMNSGKGQAIEINPKTDLKRRRGITPILIKSEDCLSQESSDEFIKNLLNKEKLK